MIHRADFRDVNTDRSRSQRRFRCFQGVVQLDGSGLREVSFQDDAKRLGTIV